MPKCPCRGLRRVGRTGSCVLVGSGVQAENGLKGLKACLVELSAYRGIVDVSVGGDRAGGCKGGQEMLHVDDEYVCASCGDVSSS